jgi:hypothetical protein
VLALTWPVTKLAELIAPEGGLTLAHIAIFWGTSLLFYLAVIWIILEVSAWIRAGNPNYRTGQKND